jgi:uncharacterized protein (DUF4415 family)
MTVKKKIFKRELEKALRKDLRRASVKGDDVMAPLSSGRPKERISLRLDSDVIEHSRASGPG